MLFNYRYVIHGIQTFQTYLDHLVLEVWCKPTRDFSIDLLQADLKEIVEDIFNDESIKKDHLLGPIKEIYEIFRTQLTSAERAQIATWYEANNDIEALCSNHPAIQPGTYSQVATINSELSAALKEFCTGLFEDVIHLSAVKRKIGDLDDYYNKFVSLNDEGKCPYCGYLDIKGKHHSKREAFDHYLPKSAYPFNSINFKNLAPMCHECNSTYKLAQDPTRHIDPLKKAFTSNRRKAFYTYAAAMPPIEITFLLNSTDIGTLSPSDIDLRISASGRVEEIETWMDIFGIEERYKAKLCAKNDGKAWIASALTENENINVTQAELFEMFLSNTAAKDNKLRLDDANFLKRPFLLACRDAGLIDK
jgi:hypothetical protein